MAALALAASQHFNASGLVVSVDAAANTITISHSAIAGYMEAMTMPFRADRIPAGIKPGDTVAFTLIVGRNASSIANVKILPFESAERDPAAASRLAILDSLVGKKRPAPIPTGGKVPDFSLVSENGAPASLSQEAGKVVAIDFIYTRCPLPDYCFRLSTNFSRLAKRFGNRPDLRLLTITFDPIHDTPAALAKYAEIWNADPKLWRFLTGPPADVERVCNLFGVAYWQDDGLYTHTLHTAIIGRDGHLAANMEGNRFTAQQLGDLVESILRRK